VSTLTYVGRTPDSDGIIVPKSYADTQAGNAVVTTAYVNAQIALAAEQLTTQSYVDTQNQQLAQQAAVTATAASYIARTKLSAASGLAQCDGSGDLLAAQVPSGLLTDRVAKCYSIGYSSANAVGGLASSVSGATGTAFLTPGNSQSVATTTAREFKMASISVPDPGYPWRVWPFGWVQGNSGLASQPTSRAIGTGQYGLLTVMPPASVSNQVYGIGIASGSYTNDWYPIVPYAAAGQTPTSVPPIEGALELDLYACCWSGTTFTFLGGFSYWVLVLPAFS
jgi:hypothetical protein